MKQYIWFIILGILTLIIIFSVLQKKERVSFQKLPIDIKNRIKRDFPDPQDFKEVLDLIGIVQEDTLNVGSEQLIRCILIIAKNDKNKIKEIIDEKDYYGDPRDVIMIAMEVPGNKNDHGMTPFEN